MNQRRTLLIAVLAAAVAAPAAAQTEIKFGHVGEPGSLFAASAEEFAKRANAKLGTKAKVVVYGSSQLGGDKELLQKLKLGTVDMALPSTVMSSEADLFGVFEMPYLVKDRAHMQRIEKEVFWTQARLPKPRKKGSRSSRSGRTATATSPTRSARSTRPLTSRASSCACPRASGA